MIYEALHEAAPADLREWMKAHRAEVELAAFMASQRGAGITPGTTFRPSNFGGDGVQYEDLTPKERSVVNNILRGRFGDMHSYRPSLEVVVELRRLESSALTRTWKDRPSNTLYIEIMVKRIDPELGAVLDLDSKWRYSTVNGRVSRYDHLARQEG
jgi:hypothetical protein